MKKENQDISMKRSIFIGATAGVAEILINHPLWVMKTRRQCSYSFTLNPFILYKGITYHAFSETLLAIFQIATSIQLEQKLKNNQNFEPFFHQNTFNSGALMGSLIGGGLSGFITGPTELIMTQQQKNAITNKNMYTNDFSKIINLITKDYGYKRLFLGSPCTAIRESLYTCGFFTGTPIVARKLDKHLNNKTLSSSISGAITGILSAIVTHPFDTIKSIQQDAAFRTVKLHAFEAAKAIYNKNGYKGFFSGIGERSLRVASATAVIGTVIEKMKPSF